MVNTRRRIVVPSVTWPSSHHTSAGLQQPKPTYTTESLKPAKDISFLNLLGFLGGIGLVWSAWQVFQGNLYTSKSNVGFYLGLGGSLSMVAALLGYPLRKHVKFMKNWGAIKNWFRIHMAFGIIGPTLILYHATFHVRSLNAGVALGSMLLVVASGIVGRFLYSRIHFGLYGRRATLSKLQEELLASSPDTTSWTSAFPRIVRRLQRFERSVLKTQWPLTERILQFLTVGIRRRFIGILCAIDLRLHFSRVHHPQLPDTPQEARQLLSSYLVNIQRVAQFTTYERIFSLWHILHVPFLFILAASSIFHIIAVYMY